MHRIALSFFVGVTLLLAGCSDDRVSSSAAPVMSLSDRSLEFQALAGASNPSKQRVAVSNVGEGILTYQATTPTASWIKVVDSGKKRSVSASGVPDTIEVYTVTAGVTPGTHVDSVYVFSSDPEVIDPAQYIRVTFTVGESIRIAPDTLLFSALSSGSNPDRKYFKIESAGGGSFDFDIANASSWLQTTVSSGTAPDLVGVDIDISTLNPGLYADTIVVTPVDTTVNPAKLPVKLTISSWTISNDDIAPANSFGGLFLQDDGTAWAVGFVLSQEHLGILYKSPDMGQTWKSVFNKDNSRFADIIFTDDAHGCLVGDTGLVMLTSDTGKTWFKVPTNPGDSIGSLWSVCFANSDTGWAVGTGGTVIRTIDAGQTWTLQASGTTHSLADIAVQDSRNVWTVGNHGNLLKTVDAGETWIEVDIQIITDLWSVAFSDASNGWIVGDRGLMLKTEDGGATWENRISGTPHKLVDIYFFDSMLGWTVGTSGTVMHTSDGGTTWLPQFTGIKSDLKTVMFYNTSTGLAVGNGGVILKTNNGGF